MILDGLSRIAPHRRDFSLLHTFGATVADVQGLPASFSIYDGRDIPNQLAPDFRFNPALPPLPMGCTGEAGAFEAGLQDSALYNPQDLYEHTPPGGDGGRDIRVMLQTLIDRGPMKPDGSFGPKRLAYFNCYGAGAIDDFDAARIGTYINQRERRGVFVGSWWYFGSTFAAEPPTPSFDIREAALHCYLVTGWKDDFLEVIPWCGMTTGDKGKAYISRAIYNALMAQPYTAAFVVTKIPSNSPVPIGVQAYIDHVIYFIRHLYQL